MKASGMAFERLYSDASGVELGVYLEPKKRDRPSYLRILRIDTIDIDIEDIDFLIDALTMIRNEVQK